MADDALKNLQTYLIQLEQVEAALLSDPSNEELLRLQNDLREVIELTKKLPELDGESVYPVKNDRLDEAPIRSWRVGDMCSAISAEDDKRYNALIDAITDDGLAAITFQKFGDSTVVSVSSLREPVEVKEYTKTIEPGHSSAKNEKSRKMMSEKQKLLAKKKKQKKFDRQKNIEEAHEVEKAKWVAFNNKHSKNRKLKGLPKRSIFATPESSSGRVGIGTCGIGGRPMTEFSHAEKWRKGT